VHDDDGRVVVDHDEEVRSAIAGVFASFDATGSACAVVGAFAGRRFPKRVYGGVSGPGSSGTENRLKMAGRLS
jgi:hypothetical protein